MLKKSRGFTFTELLVALTINALLFSALLTIFMMNINHHHKSLNTNKLNFQLQSVLMLMANDIRRAGYWANARTDIGTHQNNNPFMANSVNIKTNGGNNCILFAYDQDNSGSLPAIDANINDERFGYRVMNQIIQARPPGATFDCDAASSNWENITDSSVIRITNLTFSLSTITLLTGVGTKGIALRSVDVTITGQLAADATVTKTLTQHIRIRNDRFIP